MYLSFISDEDLITQVKLVLEKFTEDRPVGNVMKNQDPFTLAFTASATGLGINHLFEQEKFRQSQKAVQNRIGYFHQGVIGNSQGWVDNGTGTGKLIDVENFTKQIVAEIKNKHNTVKGSDKKGVYDDLAQAISRPGREDFTAYYVEIIPKNREVKNRPFTPSDNAQRGKRRPLTQQIREIDGKSFYAMVGGYPDALKDLYYVLPTVIYDITGISSSRQEKEAFRKVLDSIYDFASVPFA